MERFLDINCDPKSMSALNLAFVGDCIFDLFVREKLVCTENITVNDLHKKKVEYVCCKAQAENARMLSEMFTDDEKAVYLRGRNAHPGHLPKNASPAEYHASTALEAVFGYLYLSGNIKRLKELMTIIFED